MYIRTIKCENEVKEEAQEFTTRGSKTLKKKGKKKKKEVGNWNLPSFSQFSFQKGKNGEGEKSGCGEGGGRKWKKKAKNKEAG